MTVIAVKNVEDQGMRTRLAIQQADPQLRRWAQYIALGGLVCLGAYVVGGSWVYHALLDAKATGAISSRVICTTFLVLNLFLGVGLVFGSYRLVMLGAGSARERRFPPTGVRVFMDTPICNGRLARIWGLLFATLALALMVTSLVLLGLVGAGLTMMYG